MDYHNRARRRSAVVKWGLAAIVLVALAVFNIPVPYFIYVPGEAMELAPLVEVENPDQNNDGSFMLTTVSRLKGNVAFYLWAQVSPYAELIEREEILRHDETPEQYNNRQFFLMRNSKQDAIIAAYTAAKEKIDVINNGVYVVSLSKGFPAEKVLKVGDVVTKIDGQDIKTTEELFAALLPRKVGENVAFTFEREGKTHTVSITLAKLPTKDGEAERAGIGMTPANERSIKLEREADIETERIGGPSAGLMFSLELVDQLLKENLAKGYRIAGTGTIDPEGNVGQIGGIHHKIVAADREKAEIFFTPKDIHPRSGAYSGDTNEKEAKAMAKKIDTDMKIVPVAKLSEAIEYLRQLPPK